MAHRSIGRERFGFASGSRSAFLLDALVRPIDREAIRALLELLYPAAKGEPAWPPLAMFRALLVSVWYDLSDVKSARRWTTGLPSAAFAALPGASRRPSAAPSCAFAGCWSPMGSTARCSRR